MWKKHTVKIAALLIFLSLILTLMPIQEMGSEGSYAHKYALLATPVRYNKDADEWRHRAVLDCMRDCLLQLGWGDDEIIFLTVNGTGNDYFEWLSWHKESYPMRNYPTDNHYVDGDAYLSNFLESLDHLASISTEDDLILIIYKDHGAGYLDRLPHKLADLAQRFTRRRFGENDDGRPDWGADGSFPPDPRPKDERDGYDEAMRFYGPEDDHEEKNPLNHLYDDELAIYLNKLHYKYLCLFIWCCFSGGFIEDCKEQGRIICTNRGENEIGLSYHLREDLHLPISDNLYSLLFIEYMRIGMSIQGAHFAARATMPFVGRITEHPQIYDGIREAVFL
jgi:hypothetical protein